MLSHRTALSATLSRSAALSAGLPHSQKARSAFCDHRYQPSALGPTAAELTHLCCQNGAYVEVWVPPVGFREINPLEVEMREAKIEKKKAEAEEAAGAGAEGDEEEDEIDWEAKYPPIEAPDPILTSEPVCWSPDASLGACEPWCL